MPRSDKPTLYERAMSGHVPLDTVTIVRSRHKRHGGLGCWWAFRPPFGEEAIHAPTFARVLERAQKEWGS